MAFFVVKSIISFFVFQVAVRNVMCAVDRTVEAKVSGTAVVEAVVDRIQSSGIFPDDKLFLRRIAYVESKDGTDSNTYRDNYFGGIWQVDRIGFESTQDTSSHPGLTSKFEAIRTKFNIDWTTVSWSDLQKPLYSGLAARLFLSNINQVIPRDISGQATYWKRYYNSNSGAGTEQKFIDDVTELEKQSKCDILRADLVFVLDSSGSVGASNFQQMLTFVQNVVNSMEVGLDKIRVGLIKYSSSSLIEFDLNDYTNNASVIQRIGNVNYIGGGTATHLGLSSLVNVMKSSGRQNVTGTPQIGIVITDGRSNSKPLTVQYAERVHENDIIVFAVGVTTGIDYSELQSIASDPDSKYVFDLTDFTDFSSFKSEIEARTCKVSTEVNAEAEITGTLKKDQAAYFTFAASVESGATIKVAMTAGQTSMYASYTTSNPSPAFYDHKLDSDTSKGFYDFYIPPPPSLSRVRRDVSNSTANSTVSLYTSIYGTGTGDTNTFKITMYVGQENFGGSGTVSGCLKNIALAVLLCMMVYS
ncbi:von Willebrand factor A domain-containing protein 2 [Lingula anatina]|uniref:von Willebrand factor A domain-containing protein 2 n=1 Tax=Lingula anatina TaxID=7574 RepID=A0A1S3J1H9_LINAN|nr:von Willebrand factor A domain-containing protein 2 [Lingula anatina]|eukprot:XP_013404302.1 von Willebrand factor A domain-containing protein 2 [Lingula anatina]